MWVKQVVVVYYMLSFGNMGLVFGARYVSFLGVLAFFSFVAFVAAFETMQHYVLVSLLFFQLLWPFEGPPEIGRAVPHARQAPEKAG